MAACSGPCQCPTFKEHIANIRVGQPSDHPTSTGGQEAFRTNAREKRWQKDIPAYRRLRGNGLQPPRIDGAAEVEQRATSAAQVEGYVGVPSPS